jgi:hypothetical protein
MAREMERAKEMEMSMKRMRKVVGQMGLIHLHLLRVKE